MKDIVIWCLFSIDNKYDQPTNNLVCFWTECPDYLAIKRILIDEGIPKLPAHNYAKTLTIDGNKVIINVWCDKQYTEYRMQRVINNARLV